MKYYFDELNIEIPTVSNNKSLVTQKTSYVSLVYKRIRDTENKLGIIKNFMQEIPPNGIYIDLMSGVGFVGKIIQKYSEPSKIILNDINKDCIDILKLNFKQSILTCSDTKNFINWEPCRIVMFDPNSFSFLTQEKNWKEVFKNCSNYSEYLILCDTYSFSLRFKLTKYRSSLYREYISYVSELMKSKYKLYLTKYSTYPHYQAGYLLFSNRKVNKFEEIKSNPILISKNKGFNL